MKLSKMTKSNEQNKILRMISRNDQFERNGGGQFISVDKAFKNKKKYCRRQNKRELRNELGSLLFFTLGKLYNNLRLLFHSI